MRKSYRSGRIGEEIKRIISELLLRELKDPRFEGRMVSVTTVRADAEGSFATVYIDILSLNPGGVSDDEERKQVIEAFTAAKGLIRKEISGRLRLRHAPDLRFIFDETQEYGRHIEELIDGLGISDGKIENDSLADIADALKNAGSVCCFPHENPDGDTYGSAVALCLALQKLGVVCSVAVEENIPEYMDFIDKGHRTLYDGSSDFDLAVIIDAGEADRLGSRQEVFSCAKTTMCIDHHGSTDAVFDYNFIEPGASATSEIIYGLIEELGAPVDKPIADALYLGLVTDTGKFQFANTTAKTHEIAADLIEAGVQPNEINSLIYERNRVEKLLLENKIFSNIKIFAEGKAVMACMTTDMLNEVQAMEEETEGIVERMRSIRGVEVAIFLRETKDGRIKASMRSKTRYNVASLAAEFGGGGHARAAGFTVSATIEEVADSLEKLIIDSL